MSPKLHAATDTKGRPLYVELTPGQQHEATVAEKLLKHARQGAVIADTGYDSNALRGSIKRRGLKVTIYRPSLLEAQASTGPTHLPEALRG